MLLVYQFLSWFYNSAFIFSDFLLIGTSNRDLSQILFGQKLPKTAIVHKADQTRATASLQVQSVNAGAARLNFSLPLSSEHRLTFLVCMATWLIKLVPIWYIFQSFFFPAKPLEACRRPGTISWKKQNQFLCCWTNQQTPETVGKKNLSRISSAST